MHIGPPLNAATGAQTVCHSFGLCEGMETAAMAGGELAGTGQSHENSCTVHGADKTGWISMGFLPIDGMSFSGHAHTLGSRASEEL